MQLFLFNIDYFLRQRLLQHLLFWLFIIIYFTIGYGAPGRYTETIYRVLLFLPGHIFLTYTFFYFLIPRYLIPRKFFLFILFGVITYFLSLFYAYIINFHLLSRINLQSIWVGSPLIGQTTMLGAALAIKFLKQWYKQKQQTMEAQQQKILAELKLLRSQIHPHFLFNTLNNLYAHTLEQSPKAPEIVLKLSDLLRFMIYENNSQFIPLKKEIKLLQQYIELEQLRYGDRLEISVTIKGNIEEKFITPLLLLPLLENSFKHGTSKQLDQCWISLEIEIRDDLMICILINSKDKDNEAGATAIGGLGLQNVKKRLDLLYPGQHLFKLTEDKEVFIVNLQLTLHSEFANVFNPDSEFIPLKTNSNVTDQLLAGG